MKKNIFICIILIVVVSSGYLYLRHDLLKTKDFKPDNRKASTILDLRPAIIAKLQQLVKDGSDGLYILSVGKLDPDIISSKLDVVNGSITPDTAALRQLDISKKLPDDIFRIKFNSLHVDGIGIADLLHKDQIDITGFYVTNPLIEVYHKSRPYNKQEKESKRQLTMYQLLKNEMKKITVGKIIIQHGTLILHDAGKKNGSTRFNDVSINMNDILVDSSTQFDNSRFLFAKHARLETKHFIFPTPDSLYTVNLGSIAVIGEQHKITVSNAELRPRGNKTQFEKKLHGREEMYNVTLPTAILSDVNWWSLVNHEALIATKMEIPGGTVNVYLDKSLPLGADEPMNHFPHQLVMMIPCPVLVNKLNVQRLKVIYKQYNPKTKSIGTVFFTNINGRASHVTNIPSEIKKYSFTDFSATGLFMNKVLMTVKLKFDLLRSSTGQFTAEIHMNELNKDLVNPFTEPLRQFTVKRGQMQKGDAYLTGDNSEINATIRVRYTDLHITPLKQDTTAGGEFKKNHLKSLVANWVLIKNQNPDGKLRQPTFHVDRDHHQNFVSFIWASIMTGLVKTIGVPVKLAMKEN